MYHEYIGGVEEWTEMARKEDNRRQQEKINDVARAADLIQRANPSLLNQSRKQGEWE